MICALEIQPRFNLGVKELKSRGSCHGVTHGWWESFQKRHPELTMQTAAPSAQAQSKAMDIEMLAHYFDLLEKDNYIKQS